MPYPTPDIADFVIDTATLNVRRLAAWSALGVCDERHPSTIESNPPRRDVSFRVKVLGQGSIEVLKTAWNNNLARTAVVLQPAPRRFVYARRHPTARRAGTLKLRVIPNARGRRLVHHHHTHRVTLRLWITYTPAGGKQHKQGFYGLHLPR